MPPRRMKLINGGRLLESNGSSNATGPISPAPSPAAGQRCYTPTSSVGTRSSFDYYDALYASLKEAGFTASSRVGSVEVVSAETAPQPFSLDSNLALLRIVSILAFTRVGRDEKGGITLKPRGTGGSQFYGDSTAQLLAVHHFNNGIGSVVREIDGINETCPVRFVTDNFYDSESSQVTAVHIFGRQMIDSPGRPPSILFGAYRSAVSIPLAILSGAYEIPQISPLSTSTALDDTDLYRYFSRLIPSDGGTAKAAIDYLRSRLDLTHLGVLYVNDAYGRAYFEAIVEVSGNRAEGEVITVKGSPFSYNNVVSEDKKQVEFALQQLASTKFKVFFGVLYDAHYELVMEAAYRNGIVGPGFIWILSDGFPETYLDGRQYRAGTPLAIASQGIGILKAEGGRETPEGNTGYDRFTKAWFDQGDDAVSFYNCKQPVTNTIGDPSIYYQADGDFFRKKTLYPTAGAVFGYDSVVAMGLAACQLASENQSHFFDGKSLFGRFTTQTFEGASGQVEIDPLTTSRDPNGAFFVLYNADGTTEGGNTRFKVETVAHSARNLNNRSSTIVWVSVKGRTFVYSDGTTQPPPTLPPVKGEDLNQLSPGMRGAALAVVGLIWVGSLLFAWWTYWFRNTLVVRASQQFFLQTICFGTLVMASTIVTLSVDDRVAGARGRDIACMVTPWLLIYGFIFIFSALFSKTWRMNKIVHDHRVKRMKVTLWDILIPFLILSSVNTTVLAVWTIKSPLKWERVSLESTDEFGRTRVSYGTCTEGSEFVPYVATLFVVNISVLVLGNFMSFRARSISTKYGESKYIGVIIASMLQACCIGLPLSVLVRELPPAFFFLVVGIILAVCMSTLILMFVPKVIYLRNCLNEEAPEEKRDEGRLNAGEDAANVTLNLGLCGRHSSDDQFSDTKPPSGYERNGQRQTIQDDTPKSTNRKDPSLSCGASPMYNNCDSLLNPKEHTDTNEENVVEAITAESDEIVSTNLPSEEKSTGLTNGKTVRRKSINSFSTLSSGDECDGIDIVGRTWSEAREISIYKSKVRRLKQDKIDALDNLKLLRSLLSNRDIDAAMEFLSSTTHAFLRSPECSESVDLHDEGRSGSEEVEGAHNGFLWRKNSSHRHVFDALDPVKESLEKLFALASGSRTANEPPVILHHEGEGGDRKSPEIGSQVATHPTP